MVVERIRPVGNKTEKLDLRNYLEIYNLRNSFIKEHVGWP